MSTSSGTSSGTVPSTAIWTGGQYSLVRAFASAILAWLLLESAFASGPGWYFPASLAVAAIALGAGSGGRALAVVFASLLPFGVSGSIDSSTILLACAWLMLHVALPIAPYGSLAAHGRSDPGGTWSMPRWYGACWTLLFVVTRLAAGMQATMDGQLWLAAAFVLPAVLMLAPSTALAAWCLSLAIELCLVAVGDAGLTAAVLLHLFTLQPKWMARHDDDATAVVFYDGECALCHAAVRFLLAEDVAPPRFRIAPLQGSSFVQRVPERIRFTRPDSIVVARGSEVLLRGDAMIAILDSLGGLWKVVAVVLGLLPRSAVNSAYDAVAARRHRWFGRTADSCPLMPATLRGRIDP